MGTTATAAPPRLPAARGPLSGALAERLPGAPGPWALPRPAADAAGAWGEDHQLALYVCYELHYRGFAGVDPGWEWDPELLRLRGGLERGFLAAVRAELGPVPTLARQLDALLEEPAGSQAEEGPASFLEHRGERWQVREYLVHRSLYHLKEADPQSWAIPRLHGAAQAAFTAVQFDEYGDGRAERAHSRLFAEMMADLGLDPAYGGYLAAVPAPALAVVNLMSLFGLHRELRGALVGQFAGVEISSSPGARRLAAALERLGAGPAGTRFYREHVEADAVHEQVVRRGVIDALLRDEPALEPDIAFGLAASALAEQRLGAHLLGCWRRNRSSLLRPLEDAPAGDRPGAPGTG